MKETKIDLRCTRKEKASIKKLAEESGETASSFLLKMAFKKDGGSLKENKKRGEINGELLRELKKIGVNVNQIARRLNSLKNSELTEREGERLRELNKIIIEIRNVLTKG